MGNFSCPFCGEPVSHDTQEPAQGPPSVPAGTPPDSHQANGTPSQTPSNAFTPATQPPQQRDVQPPYRAVPPGVQELPPGAHAYAPGDAFASQPGVANFEDKPPEGWMVDGYHAPGELARTGEWSRMPTTSINAESRKYGKILISVGLIVALAIAGVVYVRTRQRPLNTVQTFWFWANHTDASRMIECWTPEYRRQHPEIQKELEAMFYPPADEGGYMGSRVRTNSYDSYTYDIKQTGGTAEAITYVPGELTHKGKGLTSCHR